MGHRRWLEENHNYRLLKDRFDGTLEKEGPPTQLIGYDILKQVSDGRFKYGKLDDSSKKRTRDGACCLTDTHLHTTEAPNEESAFEDTKNVIEEDIDGEHQLWKKKSIFFELPYWEYNLLGHNLDVMHSKRMIPCFKITDSSYKSVMVHLTVHLISEAKLGGPIHYRWMYPVEWYLMQLKSYVRNKAQPEGSIAEAYIKDECLSFCSRYFEGVETPFNHPPRNDESIVGKEMYMLNSSGCKLEKLEIIELD
nr:hypothetical protein [Tanacetum cinerariifolium]